MAKEQTVRYLFPRSAGPSETPQRLGQGSFWNNLVYGIGGGDQPEVATCELCGRKHIIPRGGNALHPMSFLEKIGIEECCGHAADVLYDEFGETFAVAYLEEFAENPGDPRFAFLRRVLLETTQTASQRLREISATVETAKEAVDAMPKE